MVVRRPVTVRRACTPKIASGKRKSNPIQVAAIVIWATLSVCIFSTSCNLALAGSVARSNSEVTDRLGSFALRENLLIFLKSFYGYPDAGIAHKSLGIKRRFQIGIAW